MKQAFLNFSGKKFLSAAFLSVSLLIVSMEGNAAIHTSNIEILTTNKTSLQFVSSTADALIFKVHVNNEKRGDFTLTIKNEGGDVLFSKSFSDSSFQRRFKLLKGDGDNQRYYFTISSKNSDINESYLISASTRTVADVKVDKL